MSTEDIIKALQKKLDDHIRREGLYRKAIADIRAELDYDEGRLISNNVDDILRDIEGELNNA
jgi:hypothetical protein